MNRPCPCGSGEDRFAIFDAAGVFLTYACDRCEDAKIKRYNPEIFNEHGRYAMTGDEEDLWNI